MMTMAAMTEEGVDNAGESRPDLQERTLDSVPAIEVCDVATIEELCAHMKATDFYFLNAREQFISRYQHSHRDEEEDEGEVVCGRGESFPDDRTERLDIASLILQHPANLSGELAFHKELFSKLKFNYLEQETKDRFLKRIFELPAFFATPEDMASMASTEKKTSELKTELQKKKTAISELKDRLTQACTDVCQAHDDLSQQQDHVAHLVTEVKGLEEHFHTLDEYTDPYADALAQEGAQVAQNEAKIAELMAQLDAVKGQLYRKQTASAAVQQELDAMRPQKVEAENFAQEALRISKLKDPQIEELGRWYEEINGCLYAINGIKKIRNRSVLDLEVEYQFSPKSAPCILLISLNPDTSCLSATMVRDGKDWLPVHNIMDQINTTYAINMKMDERFAMVIRQINLRAWNEVGWEEELGQLDPDVVSYEWVSGRRQVMITAADRVFVVELGTMYPALGGAMCVVGIEPLGAEGSAELHRFNDMIVRDNLSFTQLLSRLE